MAVFRTPSAPEGWRVESTAGLGPFTTKVVYRLADGARRVWTSRHHRKHDAGAGAPAVPRRTWWIASSFSVGSLCFAVGAAQPYSRSVSPFVDAVTYFVGSIFFTAAAYLSFAEASGDSGDLAHPHARRLRWFALHPHRLEWWATWVQLVGTVAFNVTTFLAIRQRWDDVAAEETLVWGPNAVGSVCFLVSSCLAWAEVCHGWGALRPRDVSWWIVFGNLVGSAFFGLSAVGAWVLPDGQVANSVWVQAGTFWGAVCFLAAAVLLVPEAFRDDRQDLPES